MTHACQCPACGKLTDINNVPPLSAGMFLGWRCGACGLEFEARVEMWPIDESRKRVREFPEPTWSDR